MIRSSSVPILLACLALAGYVAADAISIETTGDAEGDYAAASVFGESKSDYVAVSGSQDAEGRRVSVAPQGDATAPPTGGCETIDDFYTCSHGGAAIAGGDARGAFSVSLAGNAEGNFDGFSNCQGFGSPSPRCATAAPGRGHTSVAPLGTSHGYLAIAGEDAYGGGLGVSATEEAYGRTAVAPMGDAKNNGTACEEPKTCTSRSIAVAGESAEGGLAAVALQGDASTSGAIVCVEGICNDFEEGGSAVSGTGSASAPFAVSGAGPSTGLLAVSGTGDAQGYIAISLTGHANGSGFEASGCNLASPACLDPL